jgi:hypothetical protein
MFAFGIVLSMLVGNDLYYEDEIERYEGLTMDGVKAELGATGAVCVSACSQFRRRVAW